MLNEILQLNVLLFFLLRFLQEYQKNNITFYGVTAQNEPFDGFIPFFTFNSMGFTPNMQRIFINQNLGPTMEESDYGDVKIFVLDDNRPFLLPYMTTVKSLLLSLIYNFITLCANCLQNLF